MKNYSAGNEVRSKSQIDEHGAHYDGDRKLSPETETVTDIIVVCIIFLLNVRTGYCSVDESC